MSLASRCASSILLFSISDLNEFCMKLFTWNSCNGLLASIDQVRIDLQKNYENYIYICTMHMA